MTKPTILVTGATGKTGSAVVTYLRERQYPVRAVVHRIDARSERLKKTGAEVVAADLFDPEQIFDVMRGAQRVYYCPPFHPYMIQSSVAFIAAAREAKLEAVVLLSQWIASPDHHSLQTRQLWLTEQLLQTVTNAAQIVLNPGYFADNYLRLIDFAALLGIFPVFTGDSRNAPPSNEDIARVATALLVDPERHAGRRYRPTGPALLSAYDMIPILEKVLGNKVMPVNLPLWMFFKAARLQGVNEFDLASLQLYFEDHKQGAFEHGAPNQVVEELTGRAAEDFPTIVRRYADLPFARKSLENRLAAVWNFLRVPLATGLDPARYEREQHHPVPPMARFAMANECWRANRGSKEATSAGFTSSRL